MHIVAMGEFNLLKQIINQYIKTMTKWSTPPPAKTSAKLLKSGQTTK